MDLDAVFDDLRAPGAPGAAVAVLRGGALLHEACFGLASLEHGVPITPATRFHLVSLGKTFAAVAVLSLQAGGRLRLDDCISDHLPELPGELFATGPITIRHLLSMTSGLKDGLELLRLRGHWRPSPGRVQDILDLAAAVAEANCPPGTRYLYCNTNIALIHEILGRASGLDAESLRRRALYQPLGLLDTCERACDDRPVERLASGYVAMSGGGFRIGPDLLGIAADPLVGSLRDLVCWLLALRAGAVGRCDVSAMTARSRLASGEEIYYGLGLALRDYRGARVWCHSGSQPGYKTHLAYMPEHDLGFVMLANREDAAPVARFARIADRVLADRLAAPPRGSAAVEGPGDGVYLDESGDEVLWLERRDGAVRCETLGDPVTLYPRSDGSYSDAGDYTATQPVRIAALAGERLRLCLGGYRTELRRLPAFPVDPAGLAALAGHYQGADFGGALSLRFDAGAGLTVSYGGGFDRALTFAMEPLAADVFLVRPQAPGVDHRHLFRFLRDGSGAVVAVDVTMERLKRQRLHRRPG